MAADINLADFQDAVDAAKPEFRTEAERLARENTPFIVLNYKKERDQVFCSELARTFQLSWIEDSSKARMYMSPTKH